MAIFLVVQTAAEIQQWKKIRRTPLSKQKRRKIKLSTI